MINKEAIAERYKKSQEKAKLDFLQISAFQMLFDLRLPDVGVNMAFASAIADTGDDKFRKALEKHPELVEKWINEHYGRKRHRIQ